MQHLCRVQLNATDVNWSQTQSPPPTTINLYQPGNLIKSNYAKDARLSRKTWLDLVLLGPPDLVLPTLSATCGPFKGSKGLLRLLEIISSSSSAEAGW